MAYDYNKYIKEYNKKNIVFVSLKLHKTNDADLIEAIGNDNKQATIKKLIRKAVGGCENESV